MKAASRSTHKILLTRDQCRLADRYAIEQLGIPGVVLMENAGRNATDAIERALRAKPKKSSTTRRVAIVCGKGNNGGDGSVIARHLHLRGHAVHVDLLANPADLTGDAAVNYAIIKQMGLAIRRLHDKKTIAAAARRWQTCDVIVDALLGTGFTGEVRKPLLGVIKQINALKHPKIVAVDVPSGLNADTGEPGGDAIHADLTVTFLAAKVGLVKSAARAYVGKLIVADIGAPIDLILKRLNHKRGR